MSTNAGIEARHSRSCRARKGGRRNCTPTWRASIWNPQTKTLIRRVFTGEHAKIEAQLWRADAAKARSMGALRAPTKLTVGQAGDDLIAGMRAGTILDRSGKRYKPATIRTSKYSLEVAIKPVLPACKRSVGIDGAQPAGPAARHLPSGAPPWPGGYRSDARP